MFSNPHKLTKEQDQEIARLHLAGTKIGTLAKMFNVRPGVIRVALRYEGVDANPHFIHIRESAFDEISDEQTAYWLGFIYADGCVTQQGSSNTFSVKLKDADRNHLEKLREFLEIEHPLWEIKNKTRNIYHNQVSIRSSNKHLCLSLKRIGIIVGRTMPHVTLNAVPKQLVNHFFRGMFDGDGCAQQIPGFTFLSQVEILERLREELIKHGCVSETRQIVKTGKIYRLDYGGFQQGMKIRDYLYKDATVWMERKLNIISYWNQQTRTILKRKYEH